MSKSPNIVLTTAEKAQIVKLIITSGYFWITEEQPDSAMYVLFMLQDLALTKRQKNKVLSYESDIRESFEPDVIKEIIDHRNVFDEELSQNDFSDDDKFIFYAYNAIINIFNYGDVQMGFNLYGEAANIHIGISQTVMYHLHHDEELQPLIQTYLACQFCVICDYIGKDALDTKIGLKEVAPNVYEDLKNARNNPFFDDDGEDVSF